jgi:hypothetical protein
MNDGRPRKGPRVRLKLGASDYMKRRYDGSRLVLIRLQECSANE